jgi:hypothetical protein
VDPVQYTIRLLLPDGSLLLEKPDFDIGPYDPARLSYPWASPDPAVDLLQARLARLVEESQAAGEGAGVTYLRIRSAALEAALGRSPDTPGPPAVAARVRPHLTEPWFCCAEPTEGQLGGI